MNLDNINEEKLGEYLKEYSLLDINNLFTEDELSEMCESAYSEGNMEKFIALTHIVEGIELNEDMVRYVNSKGESGIRKQREIRSKLAYKTTTLSKAKRRETALRASKTRMSNPSQMKRSNRKRNKARRKRSALGMDQ